MDIEALLAARRAQEGEAFEYQGDEIDAGDGGYLGPDGVYINVGALGPAMDRMDASRVVGTVRRVHLEEA